MSTSAAAVAAAVTAAAKAALALACLICLWARIISHRLIAKDPPKKIGEKEIPLDLGSAMKNWYNLVKLVVKHP